MTNPIMNPDEFHETATRFLDGMIDHAGHERFEQALRSDRMYRDLYRELAQTHAELAWLARWQVMAKDQTALDVQTAGGFRFIKPLMIAAAVALAVSLWFAIALDRNTTPDASTAQMPPSVAMLTNTENAVFAGDTPQLGSNLQAGVIRLASGKAQVMFDSAAVVDLTGPCEFEMTGPNHGKLISGRLEAYVPTSAHGFVVDLPNQVSVKDLGTRFKIRANSEGDAQVFVIEGAIEVTDRTGAQWRLTPELSAMCVQGVARLRSLAGCIASVQANNDLAYQIAPQRLDEDVLAYIDRDYQWNAVDASGLPYELLGAQYVQTALADKTNAQLAVTLSLNRPTTLFLFASEDIPIPGWLIRMGFVATGLKIGLDLDSTARQSLGRGAGVSIDRRFNVWRLDVNEAGTITLGSHWPDGGNRATPGLYVYGIAAVPYEPDSKPTQSNTSTSTQPPH